MFPSNRHHHPEAQDIYQFPEDFPNPVDHTHLGSRSFRAEAIAVILEVVILAFALSALIAGMLTSAPEMRDMAINFISIILEAVPFMMVGAVIGGIIEAFVPQEFVQRALTGHNTATVFVAAGLGIVVPICECAIVPIVRRLINKGIPLPAAIAFLLGAPIVNPIVAASTWLAYRGNWGVVTTRMVCGYVIAVTIALVLGAMFRREEAIIPNSGTSCEHVCCHCEDLHEGSMPSSFWSKIVDALSHARDDFFTFGKFLIIGALVAAFARATIDVVAFRQLFASPMLSILAMMGLAVTLNLCSETDAFIAAGFRAVFPETAQMAFMVLGPMLDLKLVLTYFTIFRSRMIATLALLTFTAVLLAMMTLHYWFGGFAFAR